MRSTLLAQSAFAKVLAVLCGLIPGTLLHAQDTGTARRPHVEVRTELGSFTVALYNETSAHRDNFLKLVSTGAYDSLLFHRVVSGLMVQGGDPTSRKAAAGAMLGGGGPGYTLPAEIVPGLIHKRGVLAAARQGDDVNPERRSNGSQFYIVHGRTYAAEDLERIAERKAQQGTPVVYTEVEKRAYATSGGAPHLDGGYTVFGEVVDGMEVIDAIAAQPCDALDRPLKDIRMFMRVLE